MSAPVRHRTGSSADAPCPTGKIRHPDSAAADAALTQIRENRRGDDGHRGPEERRIYLCSLCAGWHTTSRRSGTTPNSRRGKRRNRRS